MGSEAKSTADELASICKGNRMYNARIISEEGSSPEDIKKAFGKVKHDIQQMMEQMIITVRNESTTAKQAKSAVMYDVLAGANPLLMGAAMPGRFNNRAILPGRGAGPASQNRPVQQSKQTKQAPHAPHAPHAKHAQQAPPPPPAPPAPHAPQSKQAKQSKQASRRDNMTGGGPGVDPQLVAAVASQLGLGVTAPSKPQQRNYKRDSRRDSAAGGAAGVDPELVAAVARQLLAGL